MSVRTVQEVCFGGRALPPSLSRLWQLVEAGDTTPLSLSRLRLLTSLDELEPGYGAQLAEESPDVAANVQAHQRIFERLGFFAADPDGGFLAFDMSTEVEEPPVVWLDSEGQYSWAGFNLPETLIRHAPDPAQDALQVWIRDHGFALPEELGVIGASTQFLPDLEELHEQCASPPPLAARTGPVGDDPDSWLLSPGEEVRHHLKQLLGFPPGGWPAQQWVSCNGTGRACSVWFHRVPQTENLTVRGVRFDDDESTVDRVLGAPTRSFPNGNRHYEVNSRCLLVQFSEGRVAELSLWLNG